MIVDNLLEQSATMNDPIKQLTAFPLIALETLSSVSEEDCCNDTSKSNTTLPELKSNSSNDRTVTETDIEVH